jgi:hypothetical protein
MAEFGLDRPIRKPIVGSIFGMGKAALIMWMADSSQQDSDSDRSISQ